LIEKANKQKWEKQQRKWLRDWTKAHGRKPGGVRKVWKHNEETGAFVVKKGRGGINWYRYQKEILIAKLLPFAQECQKSVQKRSFRRTTLQLTSLTINRRFIISGRL